MVRMCAAASLTKMGQATLLHPALAALLHASMDRTVYFLMTDAQHQCPRPLGTFWCPETLPQPERALTDMSS